MRERFSFDDCFGNSNGKEAYGDLTYSKHDDYVEITDCSSSATEVEIPSEIDGLPVTMICTQAFEYCSRLTSVRIPDSVTSMGYSAFKDCTSLTEITFKGNTPSMERGIFYDVTAMACYPADNGTWTEDVRQDYGGTITWEAF